MNKYLNKDFNNAVSVLADYYMIKALSEDDFDYWATDDAYSAYQSFAELCESMKIVDGRKCFPVYSGNSETSVYATVDDNVRFRFIHDIVHIENNLGFSYEDEMKVSQIMLAEAKEAGLSDLPLAILEAETAGMAKYNKKFKDFPRNQEAFIHSCVQHGSKIAARVRH